MNIGNNSEQMIRSVVDRIEGLEEEKSQIASDIKDTYQEAKSNGLDVKALREIVRVRKQDATKREAHEVLVEAYKQALGMLSDLPLGQAAIERAGVTGL